MKAKQRQIPVFEVEVEEQESFFAYFDKNLVLLKDFLILLKGNVTSDIIHYLKSHHICYVDVSGCDLAFSLKNRVAQQKIPALKRGGIGMQEALVNESKSKEGQNANKTVLFRPIRSGEEIVGPGDIVIVGRINSGARVVTEGSVEVFGTIDGFVQCDGSYMILGKVGQGHVIFGGEILDNTLFDGNLKIVRRSEDGLSIKEV